MKKLLFPIIIFTAVISLYYPVLFTYFSQDDFFHFKVSLTDRSLLQFINLFGFHPFAERGIAFYRPIFREGIFNIFYSLFGLNPYPFRILQFSLLFLNSFLAYHLIARLFNNKYLSFFVAFFYAISSAQVSSLYYLAGGIQVLGATTFLLLTLILALRSSVLSFATFLLALGSHELTSIIPLLLSALFFVRFSFNKAFRNIWKALPFFLILFFYLYLEITRIGFSASEKQYQVIFSLKTTLNSYMWYIGWAFGLPEMLIDFVFPGFKLNPNLMRYWGSYFYIILSTFLISLLLLSTGSIYLIIKNNKLFFDKKFLFFVFWFIFSLVPVILLPLHKSTQYLETGLVAFWTIIGFIILNMYRLKYLRILCIVLVISLFTLSAASAILQRTTYWAVQRGKYAQQLIKQVTSAYPTLPKGAIVYFKNDPNYPYLTQEWGNTSKQASIILNGNDALQLLYKDPTLKVFYEDLDGLPKNANKANIYPLTAEIN